MLQPINNMMRMRGPPPPRPQLVGPHMTGAHSHNNLPDMTTDNMSGQKSSATMDSQYMQQQSQIFVFTTRLANSAAEAVDSGTFASIVDFHYSNPETKKLLDKYPLKPQLNRTNSPAVWLNNLAQRQGPRPMKGLHPTVKNFGPPVRGQMANSCVGSCNMHTPSGPGPGGGMSANWPNNGNMCSNPNVSPNWSAPSQQMFAQNFDPNDPNQKFNSSMGPNGAIARPMAPFGLNNPQNNHTFNSFPPGVGGPPQMAGADIPEENLTPQQKQHREKQLAIIRKMQLQLCPEMMDSPPMAGHMMPRMPVTNQAMTGPDFMMDQNNMCSLPETDHMSGSDPNVNNCITPSTMMSNPNNSASHMSVTDWPKGNFVDDRRRKTQTCGQGGHNMCSVSTPVPISHPSPLSQPPSVLNSPSPCISQSPGSRIPPPPYNQGIRPHSSPHPSSPATGSLPMPSPRTQSPAIGSVPPSTSRAQTPTTGSVGLQGSRAPSPNSGSVTQPSPSRQSPAIGSVAMPSPRAKSPTAGSIPLQSPRTQSPAEPSRQSRVTHTSPSPMTPSADSNSNISGTTVHSPKTTQSSHVCSTSSTAVQNNTRTQTSANMKATTPSTTLPPNSSPSNVKKVPNLIPPKGMGPECGSELMMNQMTHSSVDVKPNPNDFGALRPSLVNSCSSPFMCKQEPALMPVPSPQQIQYLNAFDGQELTIQKQPNISLRDADLISPAPDLDLGFSPEFGNNCQPFGANFSVVDNLNPRFASNPNHNPNINGNQFGPNSRFMTPDPNQRFVGPFIDGPRMPNPDNQFRPQNMCMPYGQMDNNMMRFNGPCDNTMSPRMRAGPPNDMLSRFPTGHPNDQFNPSKSPLSSDQMNPNMMSFPMSQQMNSGCFNQQMEGSVSSTHLQNLQKMTPPFDMGPNGAHPHSHNGSNGSMPGLPQTQRNNFDPISSMAAMTEPNQTNPINAQNMMNMSSMQVAANGGPPGPPNMVNFHTNMSSMQAMHQNMNADSNGMQSPFPMGAQMNPQMSGGPQTVNNTYVNATMSIQQLNIQNVPTPNFNPNMDHNSNLQQMSGPGMSSPSAMQMMQSNSSAKMGQNYGHMSGPPSGPNFHSQQMPNQRPINPNMNFGPTPPMMQRCYNSANIQIKPDAPNTIQYLPPRQQNQQMSARAPSLDFLQRCEPPLTNLGTKLPTHNLQYFPSNNSNMNSSPTMPLGPRMMAQNMPMGSGPGRPVNPGMVRTPNHNSGPMMGGPDMFGRPPGPNPMNGPPNAMFPTMKQSNSDPVSPGGMGPEAAQPLPPSLSHSYNYKQNSFNAMSVSSDPNYAIQYQHFQQQLYATNTTRGANASANQTTGNGPRMSAQNNFYNSAK